MKHIALASLLAVSCGGGSVDVSQSNDQRPDDRIPDDQPVDCVEDRHLEQVDGILVCVESLICGGATVRGPEIISVPLRQCNNIAASPDFVPTPFHTGGGFTGQEVGK